MKALILHAPGNLVFEQAWSEPDVPDGWALVKVTASGVCGSDLARIMRTGAYHHPMVLGHEFAGVVEKSRSETVRPGERVAVLPNMPCGDCPGCRIAPFHCERYDFIGSRRDGGFAELCAVPAANLFALPDSVSDEEGAFLEPVSVTLHALRRSQMGPGSRVLVYGSGAIGILVAQWAAILGASEVVVADIRDQSLEIARKCGLGHTVNPKSDEFSPIGGFDNVFEAAGSNDALVSGIGKAGARGTVTVVGREVKDTVIPLDAFEKLMRKELVLVGSWGYDNRSEEQFIGECLESRRFTLDPMITHRVPLEEGPEVVSRMWEGEMFYCKVMLKPG